ncbi:MAG: hypothetical protein P1R58_12790 [bacterium]|nr:hypothetical protein [bacterium]
MHEKRSAIHRAILKYFIHFLVIVAGIWVGFRLSVESGMADRWHDKDISNPIDLPNNSDLAIGDQFPPTALFDLQTDLQSLTTLLSGKKSVVATVSSGCETCIHLVDFLRRNAMFHTDVQVILLTDSTDYSYFADNSPFQVLKFNPACASALALRVYPTLIGVDEKRNIRFVSSGFRQRITDDFIGKIL